MDEKMRLDHIANISKYGAGANYYTIKYSAELFKKHMKKGGVLELGPAEGIMTDYLYQDFKEDYTVVDGADIFVKNLVEKYEGIKGETCLFERYAPKRKFDNIILGHVLEHVENPILILSKCKEWLGNGGIILAAVPNCNSIHRKAAVKMGILQSLDELNETDKYHGHRRVYSMNGLIRDFEESGLHVVKSGGYWLKPVSNKQIEETWTESMLEAFMELGEEYPDIAGEIYVVAE